MNQRQAGMARARQEIVEAAGAEFAAHGYEGTSFSGVAAAMNKPKSAIGYHLFPSKHSLAVAVIADQQARWQRFDDAIPASRGVEKLATMLLSSALNAQECPVAAGSIRLLHELRRADIEVPDGYDWYRFARDQIEAELDGSRSSPLGDSEAAAQLVINATFGVLGALPTPGGPGVEARLKALWVPLFQSIGIPDAESVVSGITPLASEHP
ncbi:helix-turn-helix domain-containing protein [Frondihabitans sp. Leaf304]|uniref:helix-turn-helix domain-containing protein n=1 Tax=Frondihabitans sp. Leaf304 TaxID=1736329 RepID=UPI0009FDB6A9|nr:helix-turn-helix domain-containing protein [Frondihabitans sp. Leaf304]